MCVCVCVCVRQRKREIERDRENKRERERERERDCGRDAPTRKLCHFWNLWILPHTSKRRRTKKKNQ